MVVGAKVFADFVVFMSCSTTCVAGLLHHAALQRLGRRTWMDFRKDSEPRKLLSCCCWVHLSYRPLPPTQSATGWEHCSCIWKPAGLCVQVLSKLLKEGERKKQIE